MLVVLLPLCIWRQKLENSMKFLRTWKPTPHPVPLYGFTLVFSSSVSLIAFTILLVRHLQKTRIRSSHRRCSKKTAILKKFAIFKRKYLRYSLFFNKGAGLQAYNFILKRLQHRCSTVIISKFLRAPILENIAERLLLENEISPPLI